MAGDWVKIEHVTPDKPEVIAMADLLKIDQDSVFGRLCRIWIWADQQTIVGNAASVTETFVDRLTGVTGFATAMIKVGWLKFSGGILTFPNFDRHNGETAKKRAQTGKRVKRFRNAAGVSNALPEKRREELIPPLIPQGGNSSFATKNQSRRQRREAQRIEEIKAARKKEDAQIEAAALQRRKEIEQARAKAEPLHLANALKTINNGDGQ